MLSSDLCYLNCCVVCGGVKKCFLSGGVFALEGFLRKAIFAFLLFENEEQAQREKSNKRNNPTNIFD